MTGDRVCFCSCHSHPGIYNSSHYHPCTVCGHLHSNGHMSGIIQDGWVPDDMARMRDLSPLQLSLLDGLVGSLSQETKRLFDSCGHVLPTLNQAHLMLEIVHDQVIREIKKRGEKK